MKALGNSRALIIVVSVIAGFVIGIISANPVVEAAGGWKAAFDDLQSQITSNDADIADLETATTVELYKVSSTLLPPPQEVELNCDAGDTVVSGYVIFPDGVTADVFAVAINDGEGMILKEEGATELSVVTFQIICAKGGIEALP